MCQYGKIRSERNYGSEGGETIQPVIHISILGAKISRLLKESRKLGETKNHFFVISSPSSST